MKKNLNICFVANFTLTYVFKAMAQYMQENGVNIFWIVPKTSQYHELCQSFGEQNTLLLDRSLIEKNNPPIGDFKINELLYGDRFWRHDMKNGEAFLINSQKVIYDFLKGNCIDCVFGECTWAHELLIHRICTHHTELNCRYLSHITSRIPTGRFIFTHDEKHARVLEVKSIFSHENTVPVSKIAIEKPDYLLQNDLILKKKMSFRGKLARLKRWITNENIEKTDPCAGLKIRTIMPLVEELHRLSYGLVKRHQPEEYYNTKYLFFGFHKQPEASVDVCGRYFEDQVQNVLNIWRQLPPDWFLIIKEHSNAIGDRGYCYFQKFKKYKNIILVHEKSDSHELIKHSQLVVTNTGTMALEAALLGKLAVTLSPVYFNRLNYCRYCPWTEWEKYSNCQDLIDDMRRLPNNAEEYLKWITDNSFEALLTDPISNYRVLEPENIAKLAAIFTFISKQREC